MCHSVVRPLLAVLAVLTAGPVAVYGQPLPGGQTFTFEWYKPNGANPPTGPLTGTLDVDAGATFQLDVYLREITTPSYTGFLLPANEDGLSGAGVRADFGSNPSLLTATTVSPNGAFDGPTSTTLPGNPGFAQFTAATSVSATQGVQEVGGRVYLGSFTFLSGTVGGTTTLTAMDDPTTADTFTAFNFYQLDGSPPDGPMGATLHPNAIRPASLMISVNPVPEPLGILVVFAVVSLAHASKRRR